MRDGVSKILRVDGTKFKVECRVYDTHKQMLSAIRKDDISGIANNTLAYCATERRKMPGGHAAIVYFCRKYLTHGTIAHEFDHASFAIMARRGVKQVGCTTEDAAEGEEAHAHLVEHLVDAFYKKFGIK